MPGSLAVRARGIIKSFGEVVALEGVDLDVTEGRVHGLVGPNRAGKTTLLGLLLGLTEPEGGDLEILGRSVLGTRALPDGVAGFVDAPGLYPSLTARPRSRTSGSPMSRTIAFAASRWASALAPTLAFAAVGLLGSVTLGGDGPRGRAQHDRVRRHRVDRVSRGGSARRDTDRRRIADRWSRILDSAG